ncbi:acyltransferase domain-containing protein [Pseudorhodobacter turbinis]|uniref:Acyltransferase domain-containing protein n=1 Tax=Pseudorhodobacter turbinis TaxID=2500533 RepID=A0A4P8EG34_9RHOB|nr:type I polyketide synthase [Pseudorhodobacter turbinis]QCO55749.1 acyltransferase domain-containing protein [Pseudorhodobacter turbinis]
MTDPTQADMGEMQDLLHRARVQIERSNQPANEKIAVIGMSARLPGAADLDEFWDLLRDRASGLRAVTPKDLTAAQAGKEAQDAQYVPVWGGPPEADGFDAAFFGYAPREAELLDPQQRMFLECAWHALEHAGYDTTRLDRAVGVYAGSALAGHLLRVADRADQLAAGLANIGGMVAARASFHMDLTGPSVGVQTTCSSALVALHQAIQGLRNGDCSMAIAGAVAVNQPRPEGYLHQPDGISAPDGCCRPFDADAAGTVFTNGAGVVVLKRLGDALADGDTVHGVLLGSAVNNDGGNKVSITAPSVAGQAGVLAAALRNAGVTPKDIDFIETHGTGTALGDPIELAALNRSYGKGLIAVGQRCALGAVKGNLGHLDAAAGMAGLLKVLLSLRHDYLPGTVHFNAPNPKCDFGPFDVLAEGRDWPIDADRPRRAGLSAFGIGGTNAHLIVEEPPAQQRTTPADGTHMLPLSARTPEGLATMRVQLADHLERADAPSLADCAYTLQSGRKAFDHRQFVVAATRQDAIAALRDEASQPIAPLKAPDPVFVFSGQGSQRSGMCRDLYAADAVFAAALDECLALLPADLDMRRLLLTACDDAKIDETRYTQPALFATEYALARMWMARGVAPVAMLGHSIGEYVAATLAGVFSLADALRVICARGALMQACAPGAMLSVMMSEREAKGALPEGVEIAAVNAPRNVTLSGPAVAIAELARQFDQSGIGCRTLRTSHGFHSAAMEPALDGFRAVLGEVTLHPPQTAILSNVTGDWMTEAEATDPAYWVKHLRAPVRFGDCVAEVMALDHPLLVEIGPGVGLSRLARQQLGQKGRSIATLPDAGARDGAIETQQASGALWAAGVALRPKAAGRRVPLPGYPFERQTFWLPPKPQGAEPASNRGLFYQPIWQRVPISQACGNDPRLVFGKVLPLEGMLAVKDSDDGSFQETDHGFRIDPLNPDHYVQVLRKVETRRIIVTGTKDLAARVMALAAALTELGDQADVTVLGTGMQEVTGAETLCPDTAAALGLVAVLRQELPGVTCRSIDLPESGADPALGLVLAMDHGDALHLALRGGYLWQLDDTPTPLATAEGLPLANGPFLIVGDLVNGLAHVFVKALGQQNAQLVLAGTGLPDRKDWDSWLATHGPQNPASRMIAALRGLDARIYNGDDGDPLWLDSVLSDAEGEMGPIAGVFHSAAMGDAHFAPLTQITLAEAKRVIDVKRRGMRALRQALAKRSATFCLLQSSLSSVVGGHGFAAYAAANAWLDTETLCARRQGKTIWQAVRWDVAETGSIGTAAQASATRVLTESDVWQAVHAVLAQPQAGLVSVSHGDLRERLLARPPEPSEPTERQLKTAFVAPRNDYEIAVANVMSEMLGVADIGAEDNFFELGGHSLLAIQIINRLRKDFGVELPVRALLYEAPTVAGIAAAVEKASADAARDLSLLDSLLDEFEIQPTETK